VVAGKILEMINTIVEKRSGGSPMVARSIRARLVIKGIDVDAYTETSEDDPEVIAKLQQIAKELGVSL